MYELKGKTILLFAPSFFGYDKAIKCSLEEEGALVHLYDERPNPSTIEKIIIRKIPRILHSKIERYYYSINDAEKEGEIDYIFFVNSEAVNKESLLMLKKTHPNAKMILYMWDSAKNKHIKNYFGLFDKILSFDKGDCEKYGLIFRPLFYLQGFEKVNNGISQDDYEYDLSFVGTAHSDRARILLKILEECKEKELKLFLYIYIPGKIMYFLRMLTDSSLRKIDKGLIHIVPIPKEEYIEISRKTRCVVDIEHPKQTGLTMRTIEMLGACKKLMTTNVEVKGYDFYKPSNQIWFDRDAICIDEEMIRKPYQHVDDDIYYKYSIKGWIKDIFGEGGGVS